MSYDPDKHHRRSIRLKGQDYAEPGAYFVTVCAHERACLFGHVVNGEMHLNDAGEIVRRCWEGIPTHFPHAVLDTMVIMPNHVHGIIVITDTPQPCKGEASDPDGPPNSQGGSHASPLRIRANGTEPGSLSAIVQNFKSISTRRINATRGAPGTPVWLRNYYEHVVRNERELAAIREYILANPARWDEDDNNPLWLPADH